MKAVETLARHLAVRSGKNPDALREPMTPSDWQSVAEGKPLPQVWLDHVGEALTLLAAPPANDFNPWRTIPKRQ